MAYSVLHETIQQDMHDSIEDSRTALRLYRKYQEYEDAGILETRIEQIFAEGRELGFKVPSQETAVRLYR